MKTIKRHLKLTASIAGLCITGALTCSAGDLTVDNLTVTTNATVQKKLYIGNSLAGNAGEQLLLGITSGLAMGRIESDNSGADFSLDASRNGGTAHARLLFGQNALWSGALGFDSSKYFRLMIGNPTLGSNAYTALTIDTSRNVSLGGNLSIGSRLDFNGGAGAGGMSISNQIGHYYVFDYGNTHVAIGDGTYDGPGFSALDYGNGGALQVGSSLGYGQYNGGTIRADGEGVGLWDVYGASLIVNGGVTSVTGDMNVSGVIFGGDYVDGYAGESFWVGRTGSGESSGRISSEDGNAIFTLEASRTSTNGYTRLGFAQNAGWSGALGFDNANNFRITIGDPNISPDSAYTALTIDTAKRVGIGTGAPTSKLTIYGTSAEAWDSGLRLQRDEGGDLRINAHSIGGLFRTMKAGMNYEFRNAADTTTLLIKENGNVGVGTSAPDERLNVVGGNIKVSNGQFIGNGSGLLIAAQGDLSMGTFTAGQQP